MKPEDRQETRVLERETSFATAQDVLLAPYELDAARLDIVFGQILAHRVDYADLYFQYTRSESWSLEEGIVKVVSPIDDTPASRAGVLPNDYIVELDRETTVSHDLVTIGFHGLLSVKINMLARISATQRHDDADQQEHDRGKISCFDQHLLLRFHSQFFSDRVGLGSYVLLGVGSSGCLCGVLVVQQLRVTHLVRQESLRGFFHRAAIGRRVIDEICRVNVDFIVPGLAVCRSNGDTTASIRQ